MIFKRYSESDILKPVAKTVRPAGYRETGIPPNAERSAYKAKAGTDYFPGLFFICDLEYQGAFIKSGNRFVYALFFVLPRKRPVSGAFPASYY